MNTIWAVACSVVVLLGGGILSGGCASTRSQMADFSQTDVGEGPGATLRRLTELQTDLGGQRASTGIDQNTSASRSPRPNPGTEYSSLPNKGGPSPSAASHSSFGQDRATTENASPKGTVSSENPPTKPFERSMSGKQSNKTTGFASLSGVDTGVLPGSDVKRMPEAKAAENTNLTTNPSGSAPQSEIPEPREREISRQADVGRMAPAVPPPALLPGKAASSAASQYRIGPEDVLHVSVWGNQELTMDVVVRPDGKISIPLLQDVQAEGFTADELAAVIHNKLLTYIKDPHVSVIVKEINATKISVMGYVVKPGTFPLRGDLTVLQAISQAGGFTPFASPRKIKLIRKTGGKMEVRIINYYDIINKGGVGDYLLKSGDTIVVP